MPKYIVFTELSTAGCKALVADPTWCGGLTAAVEEVGGKIVEQYALVGPHQFFTVVEVRDNDAAHLVKLASKNETGAKHTLAPAIDLGLFVRLMSQSTENTGPYKWQASVPARVVRRLLRNYAYTRDAEKYFTPFRTIGAEHWDEVRGPAIFIANHASFMDGPAMYAALPHAVPRARWRSPPPPTGSSSRAARASASRAGGSRWSTTRSRMKRGGGRGALAHADWLIDKGWSIGIFPEGARTSAAKLARFRMGPAILAMSHGVPVVPMYLEGVAAIRAKGSRDMNPGPVTVRIGKPMRFPADADVAQVTPRAAPRGRRARQGGRPRAAGRARAGRSGGGLGRGDRPGGRTHRLRLSDRRAGHPGATPDLARAGYWPEERPPAGSTVASSCSANRRCAASTCSANSNWLRRIASGLNASAIGGACPRSGALEGAVLGPLLHGTEDGLLAPLDHLEQLTLGIVRCCRPRGRRVAHGPPSHVHGGVVATT